jgi:lysophospholipase L1-like esterase
MEAHDTLRRMMKTSLAILLLLAGGGADPVLKKGARVAVVGDSITEQKLYSKYLECYLLACVPELDLKVVQLGWSGEVAPGFQSRMNNDLLPWRPDVVTTCYGMNDGGYKAWHEDTGKRYAASMTEIVSRLKKAGATVVVGSPGAVDTKYFNRPNLPAATYNGTLAGLRDAAKGVAAAHGFPFANVHDAMMDAQAKAKAVLGEGYDVCGKDGFHPGPNGQFVMAYAFLKGLGLDGRIGTLTLDLKGGATATEGHKVLGGEAGKAEFESARWPFCFSGDEKSSGGTRSIQPFVPFNDELNRLVLVVKGLDAAKANVSWGAASKSFPKEALEKGINLAAEFPENPFSTAFAKLDSMVAGKQAYETGMIKTTINSIPRLVQSMGKDPQVEAALEGVRKASIEAQERMHASVRALVVPVRHLVTVTPEQGDGR